MLGYYQILCRYTLQPCEERVLTWNALCAFVSDAIMLPCACVMRRLSSIVLWAFNKLFMMWMICLLLPLLVLIGDDWYIEYHLGHQYRGRKCALSICMRSVENWRYSRALSNRCSVKQKAKSQLLRVTNSLHGVDVRWHS